MDRVPGLGKRISFYRQRAGLTKTALAREVGVDVSTVVKWENEERQPETPGMLLRLARALGVTVSLLLGDSREGAPEAAPS